MIEAAGSDCAQQKRLDCLIRGLARPPVADVRGERRVERLDRLKPEAPTPPQPTASRPIVSTIAARVSKKQSSLELGRVSDALIPVVPAEILIEVQRQLVLESTRPLLAEGSLPPELRLRRIDLDRADVDDQLHRLPAAYCSAQPVRSRLGEGSSIRHIAEAPRTPTPAARRLRGPRPVEEDLQPRNPSIPNRPEVEDVEVSRAASSESRRNWRAQTSTRPSDPSMNSNGSTATSDHSSRTRSRNASSSPEPCTRSGVPGGRAALRFQSHSICGSRVLKGTIGEVALHERVDVHVSLLNDLDLLLRHRLRSISALARP